MGPDCMCIRGEHPLYKNQWSGIMCGHWKPVQCDKWHDMVIRIEKKL